MGQIGPACPGTSCRWDRWTNLFLVLAEPTSSVPCPPTEGQPALLEAMTLEPSWPYPFRATG